MYEQSPFPPLFPCLPGSALKGLEVGEGQEERILGGAEGERGPGARNNPIT